MRGVQRGHRGVHTRMHLPYDSVIPKKQLSSSMLEAPYGVIRSHRSISTAPTTVKRSGVMRVGRCTIGTFPVSSLMLSSCSQSVHASATGTRGLPAAQAAKKVSLHCTVVVQPPLRVFICRPRRSRSVNASLVRELQSSQKDLTNQIMELRR